MKWMSVSIVAGVAVMASAQVVVPGAYAGTAGNGTFLFMVTTGRTYQYQIHSGLLTGLIGQQINGIQWRLPASATGAWPATDASFASFDISMGAGVAPAARSLTFADNFTGTPTQVRSGALTLAAGSFPAGGSPNAWGPTVSFSPYTYSGGHLTVEMRHTGMTGNTATRSFDALTSTAPGSGTDYSAAWTGSYAGTSGSNGNFFGTQFTAVPEPATMLALGVGAAALLRRRRK